MAIQNRDTLKGYFETGDIPTQSNFADLIDGMLNFKDDGLYKTSGDPLKIRASSSAEKKVINLYESNIDSAQPDWSISLKSGRSNGLSINDEAGKSKLFIDKSTGNIGIGTSTPRDTLDIKGSLGFSNGLARIRGGSTGLFLNAPTINLNSSEDISLDAKITNIKGSICFTDPNSPLMYMDPTGNRFSGDRGLIVHSKRVENWGFFYNDTNDNFLFKAGDREVLKIIMNNGDLMVRGRDLVLSGRTNPNGEAGKPLCRALVDSHPKANQLVINYANDFKNGTRIDGNVEIKGDLILSKKVIHSGLKTKIPARLLNGWKNKYRDHNSFGYFRDLSGVVYLQGYIHKGEAAFKKPFFRLPTGFRPSKRTIFTGFPNGRIDVFSNGDISAVDLDANRGICLDGMSFLTK